MDFFDDEARAKELLRLYKYHEQFLPFDDDEATSSHSERIYLDNMKLPKNVSWMIILAIIQNTSKGIFVEGCEWVEKYFLEIAEGITNYNVEPIPEHFNFFRSRPNAAGKMSIHPIMKCMSVIRHLVYGTTPDDLINIYKLVNIVVVIV